MMNVNSIAMSNFRVKTPSFKMGMMPLNNPVFTEVAGAVGTAEGLSSNSGQDLMKQLPSELADKLKAVAANNVYGFNAAEDDPEGAWENFVNSNENLSEEKFLEGKYNGDKKSYVKYEDIDEEEALETNEEKNDIVPAKPYKTLLGDVTVDANHDFDDWYYHI